MTDISSQGLIPYLTVGDCAAAIDFYMRALGAEQVFRLDSPDGESVLHAEICIGGTYLFLGDPHPEQDCKSIQDLGASPVAFYCYVPDADSALEKAVAAGAELVTPAADMFWGDRVGTVADPYGFRWTLATHVRDVSADEIATAVGK